MPLPPFVLKTRHQRLRAGVDPRVLIETSRARHGTPRDLAIALCESSPFDARCER